MLDNLVVGSSGTGSLQVAASAFGHGYCVIVYSSPSLSAVAAFRQI